MRYDNIQGCSLTTNCTVNITIKEDMKSPVHVYYILTDFYQNYRRYVKSHVDQQLRGINIYSELSACEPLDSFNSHPLYPCGLVAYSMFNDTFSAPIVHASSGGTVSLLNTWSEDNIAWPLDKEKKFKNPNNGQIVRPETKIGPGGTKLANVTDEHFIVWMRVAALPTFRKLYARLHHDFKKGDIVSLTVANNFPANEKYFALTTISSLGVKNPFIEAMYYTVGTFCAIIGTLFFLKHKFISSRDLGVVKYYQIHLPRVMSRHDVELKGIEKKQDSRSNVPNPCVSNIWINTISAIRKINSS